LNFGDVTKKWLYHFARHRHGVFKKAFLHIWNIGMQQNSFHLQQYDKNRKELFNTAKCFLAPIFSKQHISGQDHTEFKFHLY
jgi:transposase